MNNKPTPCDICLEPLWPENEEAMKIWQIVQTQVITAGMGGVIIDLDHKSVWKTIEKYKVENEIEVFEKILHLSRFFREKEETDRLMSKNSRT